MAYQPKYGDNIEGVPLPGDLPQVAGSAAPNEEPSFTLANPEGEHEPDWVDPLKAQERELGDPDAPYIPTKSMSTSQMEDEENDGYLGFEQLDEITDEGVFPETEPLNVQGDIDTQRPEEFTDIELNPDNVQYGPD